jgi:hypothetical protein
MTFMHGAGVPEMTVNTPIVSAALGRFHSDKPTVEQPAALRQKLSELLEDCFPSDSDLASAAQLLDCLFDDVGSDVSNLALKGRDLVFANNLLGLKPYVVSAGRLRYKSVAVKWSDESEDCIADDPNEWSVFRVLNLAVMASIPSRKRAAIVTSVRNEGPTILEWLAHHRASGFDDFFVYTNDNTDRSDGLLRTLANFGVINLIENHVGAEIQIQRKILEHSLHLLPELRDFEWVFYIDVDEFFIVRCGPQLTLDNLFEHFHREFPHESPSAICFNWKWFGSENAFNATDGLLLERFVHSIHNDHVKSLVALRDVVSMHRVHAPDLVEDAWLVNSALERVDSAIKIKPTYDRGQLNHYWNKSFQEFVLKRARGRISRGLSGEPLDFTSFFDWGANGRRGNLDPPDERVLDRLRVEYRNLLSIPGVDSGLELTKSCCREMLDGLNRDLDIARIYESRGRLA